MPSFSNILILIGGFLLIYWFFRKENEKIFIQIREHLTQMVLNLQTKIFESTGLSSNLLKQDLETFKQETLQHLKSAIESQTEIKEIARSLELKTSEIQTLKEILSGPKNRGYLGEIMLKEILKHLPNSFYEEQYQIGNWRVDYVLKLNDTLIPIDAKFPIQNFKRLFEPEEKEKQILKKELIKNLQIKIEEIYKKYIEPSKGTIEFALMYLANEGVYYELLTDKDFDEVWEFAREKSVFISSPKNFELICSSLLLLIRKQELGRNIQQIIADLHQLEKDLIELEAKFETSYNQLNNSFRNLQELARILNRFISNYRSLLKAEEKLENKIKEKSLV